MAHALLPNPDALTVDTFTIQARIIVFQMDIMRRRAVCELDAWLGRAKSSGLACFATFVRGLLSDKAAF